MVAVVIKSMLTGLYQYSSLFVYQTQMYGIENIGGATPKFLGVQICCPRLTFYKQWPISDMGLGTNRNHESYIYITLSY